MIARIFSSDVIKPWKKIDARNDEVVRLLWHFSCASSSSSSTSHTFEHSPMGILSFFLFRCSCSLINHSQCCSKTNHEVQYISLFLSLGVSLSRSAPPHMTIYLFDDNLMSLLTVSHSLDSLVVGKNDDSSLLSLLGTRREVYTRNFETKRFLLRHSTGVKLWNINLDMETKPRQRGFSFFSFSLYLWNSFSLLHLLSWFSPS